MRLQEIRAIEEGDAAFGGKAWGLARLVHAGARVPAGFALEATSRTPDAWPEAARQEFCARAGRLLEAGPLAVRSSAIGEDSATQSFAGLFESVLGVGDAAAALDAAGRCIVSGDSERVRAYSRSDRALSVGVVVQSLVPARAAGVCFTVDPGGQDQAILIEAVKGCGDSLVSGRAAPESWRVYRSGFGGWETRRAARNGDVLAEAEAVAIAGEAAALAERFGHALDLEWAIDGDGIWWLQARPVTAARLPVSYIIQRYHDGVDDGPVTIWANWNVREVLPDPMEPLEWTLWRDVILPAVAEPLFGLSRSSRLFPHVLALDLVHGRIYWNMNGLVAGPFARFFLAGGALKAIDAQAGVTVQRLLRTGVLRPRRLPSGSTRLLLGLPGMNLRSLSTLTAGLRPERILAEMAACGTRIRTRADVKGFSDAELLAELQLFARPETEELRRGQQAMALGFFVFAGAERLFRSHGEARRLLAAGIEGNPTTQISLGVEELTEAARSLAPVFAERLSTPELFARLESEPQGLAWLAQLRGFLERFGQRCPREFDLGVPRWSEDPAMILDLVRAGLAQPPAEGVGARLRRLGRERRAAVAAAAAAAPLWRRGLMRTFARLVERYMPLREAPKHYAMYVFQRMRQAALELGARLQARGVLEARDDVFFLEWVELQQLAGGQAVVDVRSRVRERARLFTRYETERAPDFLRSDGVPVEDGPPASDTSTPGVWRGTGASGGRGSGPVRILHDPDPKAMADGDVLVVRFADPGWTPLFPRARALVMEVGGIACHAAVVARELGIPAVFGVEGATRKLKDGDVVTVDGDAGTVSVKPPLPS